MVKEKKKKVKIVWDDRKECKYGCEVSENKGKSIQKNVTQ